MFPKIIFGEVNGVKVFNKLRELLANEVKFNVAGWTSNDVQSAIVEASTGGDPLPDNIISSSKIIATDKSYVVTGELHINAELTINGNLGVI